MNLQRKAKKYVFLLFVILMLAIFLSYKYDEFIDSQQTYGDDTLDIIAWNLQIFGDKKASDESLMASYVSILSGHDVAIVQEIRDSDGDSFEKSRAYRRRSNPVTGRRLSCCEADPVFRDSVPERRQEFREPEGGTSYDSASPGGERGSQSPA